MNILEAKNITKVFPGVKALDSVDVSFRKGEVQCIMGENGAGKSTLIKCLTGVYEADMGEIWINGKPAGRNKKLFQRIAYVPQEIDLFRNMTVAENLFIPFERAGIKGRIHKKKLEDKAEPVLKRFNIEVSPDELVKNISVSEQQLLQVARAIAFEEYDVLMLDEPTTSLTTNDTEKLFEIISKIKKEKAVIFISHKLEEVFALGDSISVFCNGRKVSQASMKDVDISWIVEQMTGKSMDEKEVFHSGKVSEEILLEVKSLTGEAYENISFQLKKGEILGFAGLVGAGRSELMQGIFGFSPVYTGKVYYQGKPWHLGSTHQSVSRGMIYLPEERRSQGILANLSVRANASMNALAQIMGKTGVSKRKENKLVQHIVESYNIKTPDFDKEIKYLSGGNQQKVIIGRSMCQRPGILIFDEPTKGIDIGTKTEIYRLMKRLADEGMGIILISSEMDEIKKCANRIICMYQGKLTGEFGGCSDKEAVLSSILGLKSKNTEGYGNECQQE